MQATTLENLLRSAEILTSAEISDALDYFRLPGGAVGIAPVAGPQRLFGRAFTVRFAPLDISRPGTVGDYLDDIPAGAVVVLDNGGRLDCTVWGGIMSQLAAQRGISGTVVHGVCRDTVEAEQAGYPLFARGCFMRTGKDRVQADTVGEPVSLGDVRVCAGDLVVGDRDGVVIVPSARIGDVLLRALEMREVEERILRAALDGMPLAQARQEFGYHSLQRTPAGSFAEAR